MFVKEGKGVQMGVVRRNLIIQDLTSIIVRSLP